MQIKKAGNDIVRLYEQSLVSKTEKIQSAIKFLANASPARNLKLGYSIVRNKAGKVVRDASGVKVGEEIEVRLHKGRVVGDVKKVIS